MSYSMLVLVLLCTRIVFAVDKTSDAESKRDTSFGNRSPSLDKFDNRNIDKYRPDNDYGNRYNYYHNYRPDNDYGNRYNDYHNYRSDNDYGNRYNDYHRYRPDNGYNRYDDYYRNRPDNGFNRYDDYHRNRPDNRYNRYDDYFRNRPDNGYNRYNDYPYDNRFDNSGSMYNPQRSHYINNNRYDDTYSNDNRLGYRDPYANRYSNRYYRRYPYNSPYGYLGYGDDPYYDRDYPSGSRYDDRFYYGRDPYYDSRYGNLHPYSNRYGYEKSLQSEDRTVNTSLSPSSFAEYDGYPRQGSGTFTSQSNHSDEDKGLSRSSYTTNRNSRTFRKTE
ncbi:uncharacterized protein LOC143256718 [Tachypleus tridentatus]|uniref:uncharacterized protein LOC143256718 n=1 Tax=Tachypleus tridentatus TaxID=6853 RepID=UPI003FD304C6